MTEELAWFDGMEPRLKPESLWPCLVVITSLIPLCPLEKTRQTGRIQFIDSRITFPADDVKLVSLVIVKKHSHEVVTLIWSGRFLIFLFVSYIILVRIIADSIVSSMHLAYDIYFTWNVADCGKWDIEKLYLRLRPNDLMITKWFCIKRD